MIESKQPRGGLTRSAVVMNLLFFALAGLIVVAAVQLRHGTIERHISNLAGKAAEAAAPFGVWPPSGTL